MPAIRLIRGIPGGARAAVRVGMNAECLPRYGVHKRSRHLAEIEQVHGATTDQATRGSGNAVGGTAICFHECEQAFINLG
jgi:hypothetical protein